MFKHLLRKIKRHNTPVSLGDPIRTDPVSRVFGLDRGTPIDRYFIETFLERQSCHIRGRVLEIADSHYSRRFGTNRVEHFDVLHATADSKNATIVGDLTDLSTLPSDVIDCFICTQTFNFIFDVRKAIQGAHHLLKPGGVLIATMSGLCQISRYDMDRWGDYWRFTTASAHKMFSEIFGSDLEVRSYGNVLAAKALLDGLVVEDFLEPDLLKHHDPDYQIVISVIAWKK